MILPAIQKNDTFKYASIFLKFSSALSACYPVLEHSIFIYPAYVIKPTKLLREAVLMTHGLFKGLLLRSLPHPGLCFM
jgi:hypothetical protein